MADVIAKWQIKKALQGGCVKKYIDLDNLFLNEEEKKQVMSMLLDYKEAFSLRDEIGACPNIEMEIDVTDKSPFL